MHNTRMNRIRTVLLVGLFAIAAAIAASKVPLADLLKDPKAYDGKTISVTGAVAEFKQKTSRKGNKYFTFTMKGEEKQVLNVYSQGEAETGIKDGSKVVVTGVFRQEKKVLDFTVKNEIDASKVEGKENGVKLVKAD
jgi:cytochrome c-type biogenesis protein CcmE